MIVGEQEGASTTSWWQWLQEQHALLGWLFVGSLLSLALTVALLPMLVVRLPADWFVAERATSPRAASVAGIALRVAKNVLGVVFVLAGIAMLVLPGQGVLTILIGLLLIDGPGKRALVRRIVARPAIRSVLDRVRARAGREPFRWDPA